jgi:hypothetical protein
MPHYIPVTPATARSSAVPDRTPTIVCPSCADAMKCYRTISKFGVHAEQLIFECPSCKGIETKEVSVRREGASIGTPTVK